MLYGNIQAHGAYTHLLRWVAFFVEQPLGQTLELGTTAWSVFCGSPYRESNVFIPETLGQKSLVSNQPPSQISTMQFESRSRAQSRNALDGCPCMHGQFSSWTRMPAHGDCQRNPRALPLDYPTCHWDDVIYSIIIEIMEETTGVFPNRIRMEPEATEGMRLQGCRK